MKILNVREAAKLLNVHIETIRRLARQKEIPAFKVGKGWRFNERVLKKWAEENYTHSPGSRVLVVDDESKICEMSKRMLEPMGYRVSIAPGGRQALEIIKNQTVDLILLDLLMPEMNGAETLKKIRKIDEKVRVILITGYPDSDLLTEAMKISPIFVLQKPLNKKQLIEAISMVSPNN